MCMTNEELLDELHDLAQMALDVFCENCMVCTIRDLKSFDMEIWEGYDNSFADGQKTDAAHTLFVEEERKSWVECNLDIFRQMNSKERYNEIAHEVAHAIEFHLFGETDHDGERWKSIHKCMGGNGLPGHTLFLDH